MTFSRKVTCPYCGATDRIPAEQFNEQLACNSCGRALFAWKPAELTGNNFDEVIAASDLPVLVDFWAAWCGPCKAMAPEFEKAALAMEDQVKFAKLDTEEAQSVAQNFNIRSIPTMILFQEGKEVARHSGMMTAGDIEKWVKENTFEIPAKLLNN